MMNRRQFLGETSCASLGSVAGLSTLLNLKITGSLAAENLEEGDDYRALVCVFLAGGNDSFNMLAPVDEDGFAEYKAARSGVGLPVSRFTALPGSLPAPDGRTLGVISEMEAVHSLYTAGKAAFVANVGTLVEPTSVAGIQAGTAKLPLGLYSHSDQQLHWQSGFPTERAPASGWGGRMSGLIDSLNGDSPVSMNISVSGLNVFQSSGVNAAFAITPNGVTQLRDWDKGAFAARRQAYETMLEAEYQNVYQRAFATSKKDAIEISRSFKDSLDAAGDLATTFTKKNDFAAQLKMVAQTIKARKVLQKRRQTFFVQVGGWDHHGSLENHPAMLEEISQGIADFQAAMVELGTEDEVTLFTASDFGRTLSANGGGGTDHGWGGNQLVVGGAVNGGKIYGDYPVLASGSALDTGRGRFVPTTSVDEYVADLALWMGVSPQDLPLVLPGLPRFHNVVADGPPVGYMKSPA